MECTPRVLTFFNREILQKQIELELNIPTIFPPTGFCTAIIIGSYLHLDANTLQRASPFAAVRDIALQARNMAISPRKMQFTFTCSGC